MLHIKSFTVNPIQENTYLVYEENASKSDGVVTAQTVSVGKVIKEGQTVTITVNKQPVKSTVTIRIKSSAYFGTWEFSPSYDKTKLLKLC